MQVRDKTLQLLEQYTDKADRSAIGMDSPIAELELDSLAMFEIVFELEECFEVELDEVELAELKTVRDLVDRIGEKLAGTD